LSNSES